MSKATSDGGRAAIVLVSLLALGGVAVADRYMQQELARAYARLDQSQSQARSDAQQLRQEIARLRPKPGDIIRDDAIGYVQITNPSDLIQRTLISGKTWEKPIQDLIVKYARPGATVLDIGSYIGTHCLVLARAVGEGGKVFAFDPSAEAMAQLQRNLYLNNVHNVTAIQKALGAENSQGFIGELSPNNAGANVACTMQDIAKGNLLCGEIANRAKAFEMVRLDDLGIEHVTLAKIDVEGHELEVLRGARETFTRDKPVLIVEVWTAEHRPGAAENKAQVLALLAEYGYSVEPINDTNYLALPRSTL